MRVCSSCSSLRVVQSTLRARAGRYGIGKLYPIEGQLSALTGASRHRALKQALGEHLDLIDMPKRLEPGTWNRGLAIKGSRELAVYGPEHVAISPQVGDPQRSAPKAAGRGKRLAHLAEH